MSNNECNSTFILLCYIKFPPLMIEILLPILSIIGNILIYGGLSKMFCHEKTKFIKILWGSNIVFFSFIILINFLLIIFRCFHQIYNKLFSWSYALSVVEIIISFISIFIDLIIIVFFVYLIYTPSKIKYLILSNEEFSFAKISLSALLFIWINILLMTLTDNLLIELKIYGSYSEYSKAIDDENNFFNKMNKKNKNEENDSNSNKSTDKSSEDKKNNNANIMVQVNNNINNNNNNNCDGNNANDKDVNGEVDNNNLNTEMNNIMIDNMKSSVMSANRLIENDNEMNKNLEENEEIKI